MKKSIKSMDLSSMSREELEQNIVDLATRLETQEQKLSWLEEQFRLNQARKFGASSESGINMEQIMIPMFNEAELTKDEDLNISEPKMSDVAPPKKVKTKSKKSKLTSRLPKETIEFTLSNDEKVCPICGTELSKMKKNIRKELVVLPAKVYVKEYVQDVYSCRHCQDTGYGNPIYTATAPKAMFKGSLASPSMVADIIKKKYVDCIPLYRQEQDYVRNGIKLKRQVLSNWMLMSSSRYLSKLYDLMKKELLKKDIIQADETTVEVLHEPGRAAQTNSYMWLFRTGRDDTPIVLYKYAPSRAGDVAKKYLGNYTGYLQSDGYIGYHVLTANEEGATPVGCLAHARRKYCDALKAIPKSQVDKAVNIKTGIKYCDEIFAVEKEINEYTPLERQKVREEKITPLLKGYFTWVESFNSDNLIKGKFREAIVYSRNQKEALSNFILDGRLECSNNLAERSIKPFVLSRKNFLFCNTPSGADASAITFSIVETAKENNLNVFRYLEHIFTAISQDEDYDLSKLLPWSKYLPEECRVKFE